MRKRYEEGNVKKQRGVWIGQWWEDGHRRSKALGRVSLMSKTEAKARMASIVGPLNIKQKSASGSCTVGDFLSQVFLPFYKRKWKRSTAECNEDRMNYHLVQEFGKRSLAAISRDELQDFPDRKAAIGLSYSVVSHLRWDLKQLLELAVAEGFLLRNPASLLFVPREARRPGTVRSLTEKNRMKEDSLLNPVEACLWLSVSPD